MSIISSQLRKSHSEVKRPDNHSSDRSSLHELLWSVNDVFVDPSDISVSNDIVIPSTHLFPQCQGFVSQHSVDIQFSSPYQILSSSVFNGGYQISHRYVNLRVGDECIVGNTTPKQVFERYVDQCAWECASKNDMDANTHPLVGMMTAASMNSCRIVSNTIIDDQGYEAQFFVAVTSGIGNLRSAGDKAEYQNLYSAIHHENNHENNEAPMPNDIGTINIFVACNVALSAAAQAEALIVVTEAKVLALALLGLTSPVSGQLATGTGTDAVAIASPLSTPQQGVIDFVGKHTILGESIGRAVTKAVMHSIQPTSTM